MMSSCLLTSNFNYNAVKSQRFSFRDDDLKFLLTQMCSLDCLWTISCAEDHKMLICVRLIENRIVFGLKG